MVAAYKYFGRFRKVLEDYGSDSPKDAMPIKPPPGYVHLQEAARILNLSYRALWEWVKRRKIKSHKPGKERFIALTEIARIQSSNGG